MFRNERAIRFVVMVTPEDLKANAGKFSGSCFVVVIKYFYNAPLCLVVSIICLNKKIFQVTNTVIYLANTKAWGWVVGGIGNLYRSVSEGQH